MLQLVQTASTSCKLYRLFIQVTTSLKKIADGIKTQTYKNSHYADDYIIILKCSYDILLVLQALQNFGELLGLKLILEKTKVTRYFSRVRGQCLHGRLGVVSSSRPVGERQ